MTHTRLIITGIASLLVANLHAQTHQKLTLDQATVFLSGAELVSSAHINLQKGDNEILFTNVAGDVNAQSLNVKATNNVVVTSATFQNDYLPSDVLSPKAKVIKDSIELVTAQQDEINTKIAVLNTEIAVLNANQKVSGDNTGLSVIELAKMLDLINIRLDGYLTQQKKQQVLLNKAAMHLARLNQQLKEEQKKDYQPGGQLLVKFYAKEAMASDVVIDYVVPHAGWSPTYDVMADNVSSPVKLYYKANIYQNSGVKWDNVRLSLSTGNPDQGVQTPILDPQYLSFFKALTYQWTAPVIKRDAVALKAYQSSPGDRWAVSEEEEKDSTSATDINNYVAVDNAGINTSFDIDLPYTIPSDGQQHLVAIKKFDVPATYRYYAVPKLDKDVFLQAQITNWEDLNLLPGTTNVFYEGTYVGQGTIDVRNTKDTMTISLGRDKKIVVKRDRDVSRHSVKTIGSNERETFAYTISVRNARKENISLVVQDQLPVSNDNTIIVEDKDIPDADYNETTGALKWSISLTPNESKKLSFGYTVKYPKGQTVLNLK